MIDRFTFYSQRFFENVSLTSKATLQDWYRALSFDRIHSNIETKCVLLCNLCHDRVRACIVSVAQQSRSGAAHARACVVSA